MSGINMAVPLNGPISLDDVFDDAMASFGPFEDNPVLGVAVSGGCDSMALLHQSNRWACRKGGRVVALSIDHAYRAESQDEVRQVGHWAKDLGIEHVTYSLKDIWRSSHFQDQARDARYRVFDEFCSNYGVLHVLLGHHLDDQLETQFMRQSRRQDEGFFLGSVGMSAMRFLKSGRILRPFLGVRRHDLENFLRAKQQSWIEDPCNENSFYERVRVRKHLKEHDDFQENDIKTQYDFREKWDEKLRELALEIVNISPWGQVDLDLNQYKKVCHFSKIELLRACLMVVSGKKYLPHRQKVKHLIESEFQKTSTFYGCVLSVANCRIKISREWGRIDCVAQIHEKMEKWDGRFVLQGDLEYFKGAMIQPLGKYFGHMAKKTNTIEMIDHLTDYHLFSLPSIWKKNKLIAWPALDQELSKINLKSIFHEKFYVTFCPKRALFDDLFKYV